MTPPSLLLTMSTRASSEGSEVRLAVYSRNNLVTLAAGRCFSGLSPLEDDDVCLSRDWPLLGQSGLDDIMLPEAGRGG